MLGQRPWKEKCDLAFPCATQDEITKQDALSLCETGCKGVFEGKSSVSVVLDREQRDLVWIWWPYSYEPIQVPICQRPLRPSMFSVARASFLGLPKLSMLVRVRPLFIVWGEFDRSLNGNDEKGGVSVSGLEMRQNSSRSQWTSEKVDQELKEIMR